MTSTFHIRDRDTGFFLGGVQHRPRHGWNLPHFSNAEIDEHVGPTGVWTALGEDNIAVFLKRGWGKSFKDMGKLKTHLNMLLGIFSPPKKYRYSEVWKHPLSWR